MKKQLGIILLVLLATVGFLGVVSAQPVQAQMGGGHMGEHMGEHMGGHNHGHSDHNHHCCCCHMMGHH